MALLTSQDLDTLRQTVSRDIPAMPWTKEQLKAALQAIEDTFSAVAIQQALSTAIDGALVSPTATAAQKRQLVKAWLRNRADRGN